MPRTRKTGKFGANAQMPKCIRKNPDGITTRKLVQRNKLRVKK